MFVLSVSKKKIRLYTLLCILVVLCIIFFFVSKKDVNTGKNSTVNLRASTQEERLAYLSQFGYEVVPDPLEVREIIIPETFDKTYETYNAIQKKQGFDLTPYAGKRVKKWAYQITNYKSAENAEHIVATLLIYDGQIIGGDVCSTALDGFMHGFVMEQTE